jgi:hypothetical protein
LKTGLSVRPSDMEVGLLAREWKAQYDVRDETLVQKLCETLENILGDTFTKWLASSVIPYARGGGLSGLRMEVNIR